MRSGFYAWRKVATLTHSQHFLIYSHPAPSPRVAFIISSKKIKLATQRNVLRRTVLDALLPLARASSRDLVLFLKSKAPTKVLISELLANC